MFCETKQVDFDKLSFSVNESNDFGRSSTRQIVEGQPALNLTGRIAVDHAKYFFDSETLVFRFTQGKRLAPAKVDFGYEFLIVTPSKHGSNSGDVVVDGFVGVPQTQHIVLEGLKAGNSNVRRFEVVMAMKKSFDVLGVVVSETFTPFKFFRAKELFRQFEDGVLVYAVSEVPVLTGNVSLFVHPLSPLFQRIKILFSRLVEIASKIIESTRPFGEIPSVFPLLKAGNSRVHSTRLEITVVKSNVRLSASIRDGFHKSLSDKGLYTSPSRTRTYDLAVNSLYTFDLFVLISKIYTYLTTLVCCHFGGILPMAVRTHRAPLVDVRGAAGVDRHGDCE